MGAMSQMGLGMQGMNPMQGAMGGQSFAQTGAEELNEDVMTSRDIYLA